MIRTGYIGTYYSDKSPGIFKFTLDDQSGKLTKPELAFRLRDPKYTAWQEGYLCVPVKEEGHAGVILLEYNEKGLVPVDKILGETSVPCYVELAGDRLYAANYHDGTAGIYERTGGSLKLLRRLEMGAGAGCHQVIPFQCEEGRRLLVPCLENDRVSIYKDGRNFGEAGHISFPKGSGPRHGVFSRDGSKLYMVTERSNELFIFMVGQNGTFILEDRRSVLPDQMEKAAQPSSAAIRLSDDGQFLYISIRGADIITVFRLERDAQVIQHRTCEGDHPRDIVIAPGGRQLLVVNRKMGGLVSIERDPFTGMLGEVLDRVDILEGVSLTFQID